MSQTSLVVAAVAVVGAVIAWRYLPARAADHLDTGVSSNTSPNASLPWYIQASACSYGYGHVCECLAQCRDDLDTDCDCVIDQVADAALAPDGSVVPATL